MCSYIYVAKLDLCIQLHIFTFGYVYMYSVMILCIKLGRVMFNMPSLLNNVNITFSTAYSVYILVEYLTVSGESRLFLILRPHNQPI